VIETQHVWAARDPVDLGPARLQAAALQATLTAARQRPCIRPGVVLVTGATGWLGRHVVARLLEHLPADVSLVCVVRAESGTAGTCS
jgi:hypothetical protein